MRNTNMIPNLNQKLYNRFFNIFIFNMILMILILLRSAGYFEPYFPLSVNIIFLIALIISVPLLSARSKHLFLVAVVFWFFSALMHIAQFNIWSERGAVYAYEALVIGIMVYIGETVKQV